MENSIFDRKSNFCVQKKGDSNLVIGAPLNFKHVYHFGGESDPNSDQLSTQTSSTILRSANSSDLGEKSPTQRNKVRQTLFQ